MYTSRWIATTGRSVIRLAAVALVGLALTLVVGASPAHAATKHPSNHRAKAVAASVTDPALFANLPTTTLQTHPWYVGGGSCTASGTALWSRVSNLLSLNGSAHTSAPFYGCRARLRVTYWANDNNATYNMGSTVQDIPTACANTDPSCPSTQPLNVNIPNAVTGTIFGMPKTTVIDHITLTAELR
jgi:hypothetical protein